MKKFCFALDLIDDEKLIEEYIIHHKNVWKEIEDSFKSSGINNLFIYNIENRLFMIMFTEDDFSLEKKTNNDLNNPKIQEWERLMSRFQKLLPNTKKGTKWRLMNEIYHFSNNLKA